MGAVVDACHFVDDPRRSFAQRIVSGKRIIRGHPVGHIISHYSCKRNAAPIQDGVLGGSASDEQGAVDQLFPAFGARDKEPDRAFDPARVRSEEPA